MNKNYTKFIDFFKKHNLYDAEAFKYIEEHSIEFDYYDEEMMNIRGIYYNFNKANKLTGFTLYLPYLDNNKMTSFVRIRPYIQALFAYKELGRNYKPGADSEIMALYFEKIYLQENPIAELKNYFNRILTSIKIQDTEPKYKIALNAQDEFESYNAKNNLDFKKMQTKAKRLSRKYSRR